YKKVPKIGSVSALTYIIPYFKLKSPIFLTFFLQYSGTHVYNSLQNHLHGVCNALCHPQSNAKAERMNGKSKRSKRSVEDTGNLKTSDPPSSSSAVA
ncbi:MAG: hypothetical protein OXE92_03835, partial [Bacteroidetes bacterium]|nr:hypothetical protein [Bacteroidota bacterium]